MKLTNKELIYIKSQIKAYKDITDEHRQPSMGWIKIIRKTLGISGNQMAIRMGVSPSRICQIEKSEIQDKVSIKSLKEAAESLGCKLVYAIIPRNIK